MTVIDAEAVVAAPVAEVWQAIVRPERWGGVFAAGQSTADRAAHLVAVESLSPAGDEVGAMRRCAAVVGAGPLMSPRQVMWYEVVNDLRWPWTLEYAACGQDLALRRWRVRLTMVPQADGATRLHGRISYRPRGVLLRLADVIFVRRAISAALVKVLNGLAGSFAGSVSQPEVATEPVPVPVVGGLPDLAPADLTGRMPTSSAA